MFHSMVTTELPQALFRAEQVRAMDRYAIDDLGIPGFVLMQRAGAAVFHVIHERWPKARKIAVLCGGGNNGGDGYVVARLALDANYQVHVFALSSPEELKGDAKTAYESFCMAGGKVTKGVPSRLDEVDMVVDALLGTGLDREVSGVYEQAIAMLASFRGGVIAVDIPSGLHADTGVIMGKAVKADITVTFIGLKQGLFTGDGPELCGQVYYSDLAVPEEVLKYQAPAAILQNRFVNFLSPRPKTAHKGQFGHVLVIGGDTGFTGAVRMAAEAAARVGAGLVSIASRGGHAAHLNATRPELMCHGVETTTELQSLLGRATVVAIGPGLGQSSWARSMLQPICDSGLPMVMDADALNLLAQSPKTRENWILTPHPGEAARLLGCTSSDIQADRFAALQALLEKFHGTCVLKGAGTLIGAQNHPCTVCTTGNPGMASGGMGDILTGIIAGLIAQGLSLSDAARMGVCLHGSAGDKAAEAGERGLLASDLLPWLRHFVNMESG